MNANPTWIDRLVEDLSTEGQAPHLCVLATIDGEMKPTARSMYCREVTEDGQLVFVSDRRTRKDDHIRNRPDAEVVFWLDSQRMQYRLRGQALVVGAETDQFVRESWWSKISDESRAIFAGSNPGWQLADGDAKAVDANTPMPSTFELLILNPEEIELLAVKTQPHEKQAWKKSGESWTPA